VIAGDLLEGNQGGGEYVTAGAKRTSCGSTEKVHEYIMKLHIARGIQEYPVEHGNKLDHLHLQADLFFNFSDDSLLHGLTRLDYPAGEGPLTPCRGTAPARQDHSVLVENNCAHPDERVGWIVSLHGQHLLQGKAERELVDSS